MYISRIYNTNYIYNGTNKERQQLSIKLNLIKLNKI